MKKVKILTALMFTALTPLVAYAFDQSSPADSLVVDPTGNVGVGTNAPTERLHIKTTDGTAKLKIEDGSTTTKQRALLEISNNGSIMVDYVENNNAITWRNGVVDSGKSFLIKQLGLGVAGNFKFKYDESEAKFGVGINPAHPIHHASGARLTTGGVWTDASSRTRKKDIREIDTKDAFDAIRSLKPVTYKYKVDDSEEYAGFIAEDVPDIVAMKDRDSLSPMDIVAVLTKVVKEQDNIMGEMKTRLETQNERLASLEKLVTNLASSGNTINSTGKKITLNMK